MAEVIISAATKDEFCRKGDFYKLIKNIKKDNKYSQKDKIALFIKPISEKLNNEIQKDYKNVIDLISKYYVENKECIEDTTSIKNMPKGMAFSMFQIGAMADNFSICYGPGMVYSEKEKIIFCISKNVYKNSIEGFDEKGNYKYHCQTLNKTGKVTPINYQIVENHRKVALFEKSVEGNKKYRFEGLFECNLIDNSSTQPFFNLVPCFDQNEVNDNESSHVAATQETHSEGKKVVYNGFRYERNQKARDACIEFYGAKCQVCGFDFEKVYGPPGKGYCHVHHVIPISEIRKEYSINHKTDLVPVCPNCHAMLHKLECSVSDLAKIVQRPRH